MFRCCMIENEYKWFLTNYSDLFKEYGDSSLAIKDEAVLGTYSSYADCVMETSKNEKLGTFIVQKCNGDESAYTNYVANDICL